MANWMEWLSKRLLPCAHSWRIVNQLQDKPEFPTETRIIRECELCGELEERIFRGPKPVCPPHQWKTFEESAVWRDEKDKFPSYKRCNQQCTLCGEVRAVDLIPDDKKEIYNAQLRAKQGGAGNPPADGGHAGADGQASRRPPKDVGKVGARRDTDANRSGQVAGQNGG